MDDTGRIRRRLDGSLDTDHYHGIARRLRASSARRWLHKLIGMGRRRRATKAAGEGHA